MGTQKAKDVEPIFMELGDSWCQLEPDIRHLPRFRHLPNGPHYRAELAPKASAEKPAGAEGASRTTDVLVASY